MIVVRGIGIDKNFGTEPVLSQCSISLQKGEIYGLVGINGAGKTTLMKSNFFRLSSRSGKGGASRLMRRHPGHETGRFTLPVFSCATGYVAVFRQHL